MRRSSKPLIIASRRSRLAQIQAKMVGRALAKLHPEVEIAYRWAASQGDRQADRGDVALAAHGGKGLFTGTIEDMLLAGDADVAVHSLKDMPTQPTPGLTLAAIPKRADRRDCLISRQGANALDQLPQRAVVGTASPRRAAQLRRVRDDLRIHLLRGNVETRLGRVLGTAASDSPTASSPASEHFDATLLAAAGLNRLGLKQHTHAPLDDEVMLSAACQGALAIQCRADDHVTLRRCLPLNHPESAAAVHAEREVVAQLHADCHSPIAVLAEPVRMDPQSVRHNADAHRFRLRARVLSMDGRQCLEYQQEGKMRDLRLLVKRVVAHLDQQGATKLLINTRDYRFTPPPRAPSQVLQS